MQNVFLIFSVLFGLGLGLSGSQHQIENAIVYSDVNFTSWEALNHVPSGDYSPVPMDQEDLQAILSRSLARKRRTWLQVGTAWLWSPADICGETVIDGQRYYWGIELITTGNKPEIWFVKDREKHNLFITSTYDIPIEDCVEILLKMNPLRVLGSFNPASDSLKEFYRLADEKANFTSRRQKIAPDSFFEQDLWDKFPLSQNYGFVVKGCKVDSVYLEILSSISDNDSFLISKEEASYFSRRLFSCCSLPPAFFYGKKFCFLEYVYKDVPESFFKSSGFELEFREKSYFISQEKNRIESNRLLMPYVILFFTREEMMTLPNFDGAIIMNRDGLLGSRRQLIRQICRRYRDIKDFMNRD